MQITKAVIAAAGRGVQLYPSVDTVQRSMLPVVDRDGLSKPLIQVIAEEALDSGIEEICLVCAPGDEAQYTQQLESLRANLLAVYQSADWAREQAKRLSDLCARLHFVVQEEPLGYGHAVYCARDFVGESPFLLLLGDHIYLSDIAGERCARQVVKLACDEACSVAAVRSTREHLVGRYGTLSGSPAHDLPGTYQIEKIIEKPSLTLAELELQMPGLRAGHYLCFFGMHVLPPSIFEILGETLARGDNDNGEIQLTPALNELAQREKYLALEVKGSRYDIAAKFGLLEAQLALAMDGQDRDEVMATIVELLVETKRRGDRSAND